VKLNHPRLNLIEPSGHSFTVDVQLRGNLLKLSNEKSTFLVGPCEIAQCLCRCAVAVDSMEGTRKSHGKRPDLLSDLHQSGHAQNPCRNRHPAEIQLRRGARGPEQRKSTVLRQDPREFGTVVPRSSFIFAQAADIVLQRLSLEARVRTTSLIRLRLGQTDLLVDSTPRHDSGEKCCGGADHSRPGALISVQPELEASAPDGSFQQEIISPHGAKSFCQRHPSAPDYDGYDGDKDGRLGPRIEVGKAHAATVARSSPDGKITVSDLHSFGRAA
jgi:hypothetical protein